MREEGIEEEEDPVPINSKLRGVWEYVSELESDIEMWEPIMPRPIVLVDSEHDAGLNGPPEILSNTVAPMPFEGKANVGGLLKDKV